jgi:hypothetical protein
VGAASSTPQTRRSFSATGPGLFKHYRQGRNCASAGRVCENAGCFQERHGANPTHLLWLDMEMTGLSPDTDRIIELAIVVTDADLNTVAEGPVLVVHQPDEVMKR